ncbi:hypothetical protein [Nocardia sp. NPDC057030]|uniref:hypothetical protein n=1 Tax=unclassified Nocardia TaxID=2637762 RepID=UPI00362CBE77
MTSTAPGQDETGADLGRRYRAVPRSAEAHRESMIASTMKIMEERGLPLDLKYMDMTELRKVAGVPKSTYYRIWRTHEEFYIELVEAMVQPDRATEILLDEGTVAAAEEVLAKYAYLLRDDRGCLQPDVEGRRRVLHEIIRRGVEYNFENTYQSRVWRTYSALAAALPSLRDDGLHARARDVLAAADSRDIKRMAAFYTGMLAELGWRFRADFKPATFAAAAAAVINGLAVRTMMNPAAADPVSLADIEGKPVEWHPAAIGFLALLNGMTEPIEVAVE